MSGKGIKLKETSRLPSLRASFWMLTFLIFGHLGLTAQPTRDGGFLQLQTTVYQADNIPPRYQNFTYALSGNYELGWEKFRLPLRFILSDREQPYRQSFNRISLQPTWNWGKAYLGHSNLHFSPHTLAGVTFFGSGVEINPRKFRFAAMAGRLNRSVREDSTASYRQTPAFTRLGYGLKIGVGTKINFFDLIVFKARDDDGSLPAAPQPGILPTENLVAGLASKFLFAKKWALEFDAAASAFTRDLRADTLDDPPQVPDFLLVPRRSTKLLGAGQASFGYQKPGFNLKINYRRIEPGYRTLGAYFFQTDLENATLSTAFRAFQKKLRCSGSLGLQRDNLLDQRAATSHRVIGSLKITAQPSKKWQTDAAFFNYGIRQQRPSGWPSDTILYAQVNQNFSWNNVFTFLKNERLQNLALTTYLQTVNFEENGAFAGLDTRIFQANANYFLLWQNSGWSINTNLSWLRTNPQTGDPTIWAGATAGFSKNFTKKSALLGASATFTGVRRSGENLGNNWLLSAFGNARLDRRFSVFANLSFLKNDAPVPFLGLGSFSEFRGNAGVRMNFNFLKT